MKRIIVITIFFLLPTVLFAQQTYVPDDYFEWKLISLGLDSGELNDSVPTANIDTVKILNINNNWIEDLTGIEDFAELISLRCRDGRIIFLDVSKNTNLEELECPLNDIKVLDLSKNIELRVLKCYNNNLLSLDLSLNTNLEVLICDDNNLTSLDVRNGNNYFLRFSSTSNPELLCIQVDDSIYSRNSDIWIKDEHAIYSEDCSTVGVEENLSAGTDISIFPNPASKSFVVKFGLAKPQTVSMSFTDLLGKKINELSFKNVLNINEEIDVSDLTPGVYILNVRVGEENVSRKVVVE